MIAECGNKDEKIYIFLPQFFCSLSHCPFSIARFFKKSVATLTYPIFWKFHFLPYRDGGEEILFELSILEIAKDFVLLS